MREFRLALYFILGLMLGGYVALSHAETTPAIWNITLFHGNGSTYGVEKYPTMAAAGARGCDYRGSTLSPPQSGSFTGYNADFGFAICTFSMWGAGNSGGNMSQSCPTGSEAIGSTPAMVCNFPVDCPAGTTRDPVTGVCGCPAGKKLIGEMCITDCPVGYHLLTPDNGQCEKDCAGDQTQQSDGKCTCQPGKKTYFSGTMAQAAAFQGSGDCVAGCSVKASFVGFCAVPHPTQQCLTAGTSTGAACSSVQQSGVIKTALAPPAPVPDPVLPTPDQPNPPKPDPKTTADNNKDPEACGNAGGVFMQVGGASKCATPSNTNSMDKITVDKKTSVVINSDGTKTETTENNIFKTNPLNNEAESSRTVEKVIKDGNGNVIGSSSGTSSSSGVGDKSGVEPGQCAKEPNSPICKIGTVSAKGKFSERDADIAQAKAELTAKFNSIKSQISTMFGSIGAGSGELPCPDPVIVLGKAFDVCVSKYSSQLSGIGLAVLLMATLAAAFIIFRR